MAMTSGSNEGAASLDGFSFSMSESFNCSPSAAAEIAAVRPNARGTAAQAAAVEA